jgi:uncharacterized protein
LLQLETALKFHLNKAEGLNLFTAYGDNYVSINHQRYDNPSIMVTPDIVITDWAAPCFADLSAAHCESLLKYEPEIILLGTGKHLHFPHPSITAPIAHARIGLEVMDNQAACRTYNILVSEGRRVMAVLLHIH